MKCNYKTNLLELVNNISNYAERLSHGETINDSPLKVFFLEDLYKIKKYETTTL